MINVSNAFRKELYTGNRNWLEYIDVTLKSGTILHLTNENIWSGGLTIEDAVSSDNSFDIGGTVVNQCTVVINNIYDEFSDYDFSDAKVIVYVGLNLPNGTTERIRKGTYTVNEPKYNGSLITLTCYDNMSKFDRPYSESTLSYPATLNQIVRDACSTCDVTLQTYDFPHDDFVVTEKPSGESTTFREVIGWAAQIACCFCRCDTLGRLEIKWYNVEAMEADPSLDGGYFDTDNPYSSGADADGGNFNPWNAGYEFDSGGFEKLEHFHHIYSTYSMNVSTDDVVITGVKILEKAPDTESGTEIVTYMTGQEGYVITIEGNELIRNGSGASIVGWIGEKIIGMRFRKADFTHESDPTIEAGDVGFLTDWKQRSYDIIISSTKFTTGGSQSTKSSAEDPLKNSATRFSNATKNYVEYRKEIQKEKTDREQAVEELSNRLNNSSGTFTTVQKQSDGSNIYYLHNKPTLDESDIIWKMTAEAWGVSTDGGKTYNAGMTVDGDTIVRILTAVGINADWIKTGTLTVGGKGTSYPYLKVLNSSGKQIGIINANGAQLEGIFINRNGEEWIEIDESVLKGGYGQSEEDGILDLSAQYAGGERNVVLEAIIGKVILKSPNGEIAIEKSNGTRYGFAVASQDSNYGNRITTIYTSYVDGDYYMAFQPTSGTTRFCILTTSDEKLKRCIKETKENGLNVINAIHHKQFDMAEGGHKDCGYIAQDLQNIKRNFVVETPDSDGGKTLQVNTFAMLPYITKAIQELSQENKKLKEKLEFLERMVNKNGDTVSQGAME